MRKIVFMLLFICATASAQYISSFKNEVSAFMLPEFNFDVVKSINSNNDYHPRAFSYSTGVFYKRIFKDKFYLKSGLFYSQLNDFFERPNYIFTIDTVSFSAHRIGLPLYVGYYFNPYGFVFTAGLGGGLNVLFNIMATEQVSTEGNKYYNSYQGSSLEDFGLEFNLHFVFLFKPHPRFSIGIEPHVNFNAAPIVVANSKSNYLRIGGMFNMGYCF